MAFWIAIFMGLIVALIYSRRGFYEALILAFNLNLSMYLALYVTPTLLAEVPTAIEIPGGLALVVLMIFALSFGLLFAASFVLFTGQYSVPIAKVLDWFGGGIMGCLTGFLGTSFLLMVVTLKPMPGVPACVYQMNTSTNMQVVCSTCDKIHYWVGADRSVRAKDVVTWLMEKAEERPDPVIDPNSDPNTPIT
jgi:hypothetical protein